MDRYLIFYSLAFILFALTFGFYNIAYAAYIQSDSFRINNNAFTSGNFSSSDSFRLFGNIADIAIGRSTSDGFILGGGLLYYPDAAAASPAAAEKTATPAVKGEGIVLSLLKKFLVPTPFITRVDGGSADINGDGKVDIKDFGAFLYYQALKVPNPADLNKDGIVNSKDLSHLFFGWTERFIAFQPEPNSVLPKNYNVKSPVSTEQQNSIFPREAGTAAISKNIFSDSTDSNSKKGFSALLDGAKNFIIKVLLRIKSIF